MSSQPGDSGLPSKAESKKKPGMRKGESNTPQDPIVIDDTEGESNESNKLTGEELAILEGFMEKYPFIQRNELITMLRRVDFDQHKGSADIKLSLVTYLQQMLPDINQDDIKDALQQTRGDINAALTLINGGLDSDDEKAIDNVMQTFSYTGITRVKMTMLYQKEGKSVSALGTRLLAPEYTPFYQFEEVVPSASASAAVTPEESAPALYTEEQLQNLEEFSQNNRKDCIAALRQEHGNWDLALERLTRNNAALMMDLSDESMVLSSDDEDSDDEEEQSSNGSDDEGTNSKPKNKKPSCKPNGGLPFDSDNSDSEQKDDDDLSGPSGLPDKKRRTSGSSRPDTKRPRREGPSDIDVNDDNATWAEELDDGVGAKLIFEDGDYPTRIRSVDLWRIEWFANYMNTSPSDDENRTIRVPGIVCKDFRLVFDFVMTKKLRLNNEVYPGPEHKLDGYISFFKTATALRVRIESDLEMSILSNMEKILVKDRYVLHGRHIQFAYAFRKNSEDPGQSQDQVQDTILKPTRDLFVKSATRCYAQYRDNPLALPKGPPVYDSDDDIDVARRDAFTSGFRFDREMERIKEFRYDLLESFDKVWRGREWKNGDKINACRLFLDPLTYDRFECD